MDLEAFFTSIPAARVRGLLEWTVGVPEPVARTVTGLVTTVLPRSLWRRIPAPLEAAPLDRHRRLRGLLSAPHLPQGAPTSPALANLVCFRLDRRLAALADAFGATYTRYVDDLTFGGGAGLRTRRLAERVRQIAADEGFRVNEAKTRTATSARRQTVVGVVVNDRPALPRPERDALRALLHNCATHGWASQTRDRDPATFRDHVLGRVAWAASVDPDFGARLHALAGRIDWAPGPN
jgi:hypothetical protein